MKIPTWLQEFYSYNGLFEDRQTRCPEKGTFLMVKGVGADTLSERHIGIFRDGPFLPIKTGAASSIYGMMNALVESNFRNPILIKCYRDDDIELYKTQKFDTIFVNPEDFYFNESDFLARLMVDKNIGYAHIDSAEAVNIQQPILSRFSIKTVFEVHNIESDLVLQFGDTKLASYLFEQEKEAVDKADWILLRSDKNLKQMREINHNVESKYSLYRGAAKSYDIEYTGTDISNRLGVLFLGNLNYTPNLEAVNVIVKQILPKLNKDLVVHIIGDISKANLPVVDSENIIFHGRVEGVNSIFRQCKVALAPLNHGSGTRLKILDYMLAGIPVISTTLGAEGLDPYILKHIHIEDDFEKYADIINNLHHADVGALLDARNFIVSNWSWSSAKEDIIGAYNKLN